VILRPPPLPERVLAAARRVRECEAAHDSALEDYRELDRNATAARKVQEDAERELKAAQRELLDLIARGEGPL